jgi:hypothetical protein
LRELGQEMQPIHCRDCWGKVSLSKFVQIRHMLTRHEEDAKAARS